MAKRGTPSPKKGKSAVLDWMRAHLDFAGDECLIWPFSVNWNGYGHLKYEEKIQYAHRVMCRLAHGEPPSPKHVAAHSCHNGQGGCISPRHLSWQTPRENLLARREVGTHSPKKRWTNKGSLTADQVRQIRSLKGRMNQRQIGALFGISYQHVSVVQRGKLRGHPL